MSTQVIWCEWCLRVAEAVMFTRLTEGASVTPFCKQCYDSVVYAVAGLHGYNHPYMSLEDGMDEWAAVMAMREVHES